MLVTDVYDLTRVKKLNTHFKVYMFVEVMFSHYASNSGQGVRVDDDPGYDVNDDTNLLEILCKAFIKPSEACDDKTQGFSFFQWKRVASWCASRPL